MDLNTVHLLDSLGWAIIHSLWLGGMAALAVFIFRSITKDSQAALRCGFELMMLAFCFFAFLGVFISKFIGPAASKPVIISLTELVTAPIPGTITGVTDTGSVISGSSLTKFTPILGVLWCLGFILLAARYSIGLAMTRRLKTRGLSEAPENWTRKFQTLVLNTGIVRHVSLHISNRVTGPVTLGFFKPVVLVPSSFFSGLPADQIEAILLHEIAHIRRHDYMINLFQTAIKTVLFFHPAVHYICRRIDDDREKACDDFAVNYTRNPAALAMGLAKIRLNLDAPDFAMAASNKNTPLMGRLIRLTMPEDTRRRPGQLLTSLSAILAASILYSAASVEFANANSLLSDEVDNKSNLHVSAETKNYWFEEISHNDRNITIKVVATGTRWVNIDQSWYDIDKNPDILNSVPDMPVAPIMPRPEAFNSYMKFEKAANQYKVNLDYYIATLENNACRKCTKEQLHFAEKQRKRVSEPHPDFDRDFLNPDVTSLSVPSTSSSPAPAIPAFTAPKPQPISLDISPPDAHVIRPSFSVTPVTEHSPEDLLTQAFEADMEKIGHSFDDALNSLEQATEIFAHDPSAKGDYENAKDRFARVIVEANSHRHARTRQYELEMSRLRDLRAASPKQSLALGYSRDVMVNLKQDGLIAPDAVKAEITYVHGNMIVDGKDVPPDKEGSYCSLNRTYNIDKSDNMRIKIGPNALTLTNHSP